MRTVTYHLHLALIRAIKGAVTAWEKWLSQQKLEADK
jgi:hypothetical protein